MECGSRRYGGGSDSVLSHVKVGEGNVTLATLCLDVADGFHWLNRLADPGGILGDLLASAAQQAAACASRFRRLAPG